MRTILVVVIAAYVVAGIFGLFALDVEGTEPEPVEFDDTVTVGLTLEEEFALGDAHGEIELPRAQVFYSQYPLVVGYYGVERFIEEQRRDGHDQQFGHPMTVYVTTYDEGPITLTQENYPTLYGDLQWHPAEEVSFVVGSEAENPSGETLVPFADPDNADHYLDMYGGELKSWEEILEMSFDVDDADAVRERTDEQQADADRLVANTTSLLDREEAYVVGEDGDTVQETVDNAPAGVTVYLPEDRYQETVEIANPLTLAGEQGTELVGDGNGTVLEIQADDVAVTGLSIEGVGDTTPGAAATDDHVAGGHDHDHGDDDDAAWDDAIEDDYASGDAGIAVDNSTGVLIQDVSIHTPASGVMLRDSPHAVVRNVSVDGNPEYLDAHMGLVAMRSPGVVENSTFRQGLDGVYSHRSDEIVVRNNRMEQNRMGIHLMHTSQALLANNTIRDQQSTGIYVMTGPEGNGIVDNDLRGSLTGLDVGGTDTYVADNAIAENNIGIRIDATSSVLERNLVLDNGIGITTRALLPTNRVFENDFVGNVDHVGATTGPERIWTHEERGNYWEGAVGMTDGEVLDREYRPTDDIDANLHAVDGTPTLAQSPGLDALAGVEEAVSGMRDGEIIDTAPRCGPVHEEYLQANGWTELEPTCSG